MEDHEKNHNIVEYQRIVINEFYKEHKHYVLPIVYLDESNLKGALLAPTCYEFNCEELYTVNDMRKILKDTEALDKDIESIRMKLNKYPENIRREIIWRIEHDYKMTELQYNEIEEEKKRAEEEKKKEEQRKIEEQKKMEEQKKIEEEERQKPEMERLKKRENKEAQLSNIPKIGRASCRERVPSPV